MPGDGAQDYFLPQVAGKGENTAEKTVRIYFFAICMLFLLIILLYLNNLISLRNYRQARILLDDMHRKVKAVVNDDLESEADPAFMMIDKVKANESKALRESLNFLEKRNKEMAEQIQELKRRNDELANINKELQKDNIELQNTLKKAAEVGIKPQSYTKFEGISSRGELERGTYLGKFLGTAYTPSKDECGNDKGITNSGKPIIPGISIAVDTEFWPFGTVFYIRGLGYAVAMDTGSAIKGKYRFDFAVFDKKFAGKLGSQYWDVYLVKMGDGSVNELAF